MRVEAAAHYQVWSLVSLERVMLEGRVAQSMEGWP